LLLASDRQGFMQECYFTYSHSPLKDGTGTVLGVLTAVIETTPRVLSERRMRALRDLSNATLKAATEAKTAEQACRELINLLCSDNPDVPFAVQYLTSASGGVRVVASKNIDADLFPRSVAAADHDPWGIGAVLRNRDAILIDHSPGKSPPLPGVAWHEPTTQLVALPMTVRGRGSDLIGVLVVGINLRLRLDEPYLDFLKLVAAQLAGSVSTLCGIDEELRSAEVRESLINELQQAKQAKSCCWRSTTASRTAYRSSQASSSYRCPTSKAPRLPRRCAVPQTGFSPSPPCTSACKGASM
jgi:hypothetical protein